MEDSHECCHDRDSHDSCEYGHCHAHESCSCCHSHEHHEPVKLYEPGLVVLAPENPSPDGFSVTLDQSQNIQDSDIDYGFQPDTACPDCIGGTVPCTTCWGSGNESCTSCGGYGWETCTMCSGVGEYTCTNCGGGGLSSICAWCGGSGEMPCPTCGGPPGCAMCGDGFVFCTYCSGLGGDQCLTCMGTGMETCITCTGAGGWTCMPCSGTGNITCGTCSGAGDLGPCSNCGADGFIDLDHMVAQEFTPSTTGKLDHVRVQVSNFNSFTSDLYVFIADDVSQISDEVAVSGDGIGIGYQWIDVAFNNRPTLYSGSQYYIVIRAEDYDWAWASTITNPYPGGMAYTSTDPSSWIPLTAVDAAFETYMSPPYNEIYDVYDLQNMKNNLSGNFLLMNDIDASDTATWNGGLGFEPIGDLAWPFTGRLEGDGHVISGLYVDRTGENYSGLFGYIGPAGMVNDTGLISEISAGSFTGGFVGDNHGTITNCYVETDVYSFNYAGGFSGMNYGIIERCYSKGTVATYSTGTYVGGLIGYNMNGAHTTDCYSLASVSGYTPGGLIGYNQNAFVDRCYATGAVTGSLAAGLISVNDGGTVTNSFWDMETTGRANSDGGTGATTVNMMNIIPFGISGWDFTNVWWIADGNTRPFLRMEHSTDIRNSHQLQLVQLDLAADYVLAADLDLFDITEQSQMWGTTATVGKGFMPIGTEAMPFTGTLDGNDFMIDHLYIDRPAQEDVGLFNYIDLGAEIHDLTMENIDVTGYWPVGGLAANSENSLISNVHVRGYLESTDEEAGLLVGFHTGSSGRIENCSTSGTVIGATYYIGGVVGYNMPNTVICYTHSDADVTGGNAGGFVGQSSGTIYECYSTGNVTGGVGGVSYVGGFAGAVSSFSNVHDCYSRGCVTGANYVGGFTGALQAALTTVTNCYSTGSVTGTSFVGGFTGYVSSGGVNDCFWDTDTSGHMASAGGTGRTTAEMMQQATFTNWDFDNVWGIQEMLDYPVFMANCQADLVVTTDSDTLLPSVGPDAVTYTFYLFNAGPDPAFNARLSVLLPPEMSASSANPIWETIEGQYVNWTAGTLSSGTALFYLTVNIDSYASPLFVTATGTSNTGDPDLSSNTDTIGLNVNQAPEANPDLYSVSEDTQLAVAAPGVLANDSDPEMDTIYVDSYDGVSAHGATVAMAANGSFTYDPMGLAVFNALAPGEHLNDTFDYTIDDGNGGLDTATVTVTVNGLNDAPTITTVDVFTGTVNAPYTVDYNANDPEGDSLAWSLVTNATWLTISAATGILNGTPPPAASGRSFSVTVMVTDGNGGSDWTNFTISIGVFVDTDGDGIPDATDTDDDNDGVADTQDDFPLDPTEWADNDGDTIGDNADTDDDNDGVPDTTDDFPLDPTEWLDTDSDTIGDNGDTDDDDDGVPDTTDDFPLDANESVDTDGDGIGDNADTDDDDDGVLDSVDDFPLDPSEWLDTDGDGTGNNADTDDDDDGVPDASDLDPLDPEVGAEETDTDGDGTPDDQDAFPADPTETTDTDSDGIGDNSDDFPTDPAASADTDNDGMPDDWNPGYTAADSTTGLVLDDDDDNDGIPDSEDDDPLDPAEEKNGSIWLYLIIILVIVGIASAGLALKPKKPKAEPVEFKTSEPPEEPPNFEVDTSELNKVKPNIAEEGAVTYTETQTPYDRLG